MKRLLITLMALSTMSSVAARADDDGAAPSVSWAGAYAGIQTGYQFVDADFRDPIPPYSGTYDMDGALLGAHIGYNHQMNGIVIGIEGNVEAATGSGVGPTQLTDVLGKGRIDWQAAIRGRLGYATGSRLYYVTGGVAFADFDFNYTCCGAGFIDPLSETLVGWQVGGGVEVDLGDRWSTRAEVLYTDFELASGSIANCCAGAPFRQEHDVDSLALKVVISKHF